MSRRILLNGGSLLGKLPVITGVKNSFEVMRLEQSQRVWKKTGGIGNQKNRDYLDHCIVKIG